MYKQIKAQKMRKGVEGRTRGMGHDETDEIKRATDSV